MHVNNELGSHFIVQRPASSPTSRLATICTKSHSNQLTIRAPSRSRPSTVL